MRKLRVLSLSLAICLVFGLSACNKTPTPTVSPSATAKPSPSAVPTEQLTGFLKVVSDRLGDACTIKGNTIKLTKNVKLKDNAGLLLDSADMFSLDFNGHTITSNITQAGSAVITCSNGNLNLLDSAGGGGIIMAANVEAYAVICEFEGVMNLSGIIITASLSGATYGGNTKNRTGAYALLAKEGGKLTVNSGSYSGNVGVVVEYVRRKPVLVINGGSFSSFADLSGGADISAFLGSGKKAVKAADGSIVVGNS